MALIAAMRRLEQNADYGLLRSLWLNLRGGILEDGKRKPSEASWSKLDGFDTAIMEIHKWSSQHTGEDDLKRRAEDLAIQLGGGK